MGLLLLLLKEGQLADWGKFSVADVQYGHVGS